MYITEASKYIIGLKTLDGQRTIDTAKKCKKSEGIRKYTSHRGNRYEVSYQIAVRFPGMFHTYTHSY